MTHPPNKMTFEGFTRYTTSVSSGACIFGYYRSGQDASKPILILLHGYPQNHLMWSNFVAEIPVDFGIYVPDLPGYASFELSFPFPCID